jgi:hypothetical protein
MHFDGVLAILDTGGFVWPDEHPQITIEGWVQGESVRRYQMAFAGASRDSWLAVDGLAGPLTQRAMEDYGQRLAANFLAGEFRCRHCGRNAVRRELVAALQQLRGRIRVPVNIFSGYRCERHPATLRRPGSMHPKGLAADVSPPPDVKAVRGLQAFSGIGTVARGSRVRHVDVRHVLPAKDRPGTTPRVTVGRPDVWSY